MRPAAELLPAEITIRQAIERVGFSKFQSWVVTEDSRRVLGVINLSTLQRELPKRESTTLRDLFKEITFPHVHVDQSMDLALERMGANHVQVLPVVGRADIHELLGIVTLGDILDSYGLTIPASK